jgi:predicted restriction endonuclease
VNWVIRKAADISAAPRKQNFFVQQTLKDLKPNQIEPIIQAYLNTYPNDPTIERQLKELLGNGTAPRTQTANDLADPITKRVLATTYRILRDTQKARQVKKMHKHRCQICGDTITLPDGSRYAEAHHVQPLGGIHSGPDDEENILCLCPNHHAACDLGAIRLSLDELGSAEGHAVGGQYIDYHNREVYRG